MAIQQFRSAVVSGVIPLISNSTVLQFCKHYEQSSLNHLYKNIDKNEKVDS